LLLLGGFDHHSLRPERWRQRAVGVPQSHENHILSAPLLFNIAMARRWPPCREDEQEIGSICRELGLSDLIARMPGGLQQMVGTVVGSFHKASAAASAWRGLSCSKQTCAFSTKALPRSILRPWTRCSSA